MNSPNEYKVLVKLKLMADNPKQVLELKAILNGEKNFNVVNDVLLRQIENEAILMCIPTGAYYNLSETSISFWEALQNKQPLQPVVNQIINEYEVEPSRVVEDLRIFLQDLLEFGIIHEPLDT